MGWTKNEDLTCNIVKNLCTAPARSGGWNLELNIVQWGDNEPKFDLRPWSPEHDKWGKGCPISKEELKSLSKYFLEHPELQNLEV